MREQKEVVMPYAIHREGFGKYHVVNEENGKVMGKFYSRRQAISQMRALYANEPGAALRKRMMIPTDETLWEKAKTEAKSRFSVYPSAYANAWASRWYKERGGEWRKSSRMDITRKENSSSIEDKKPKENPPPVANPQTNVFQLTPFERYIPEQPKQSQPSATNATNANDNSSDKTLDKSSSKSKDFWLREPWVDISRPVIDESGVVIGFHPCGKSVKEVRDSMAQYRTSYPRCIPKSAAMRMNAMQREALIRRTNPQQIEELMNMSAEPSDGDDE